MFYGFFSYPNRVARYNKSLQNYMFVLNTQSSFKIVICFYCFVNRRENHVEFDFLKTRMSYTCETNRFQLGRFKSLTKAWKYVKQERGNPLERCKINIRCIFNVVDVKLTTGYILTIRFLKSYQCNNYQYDLKCPVFSKNCSDGVGEPSG